MASFLFAAVVLWQSCLSSKIQYDTYYFYIILDASIFTVVPVSQYAYVNDTVTFDCATNMTGYVLSFIYFTGPGVSLSASQATLDIPGGGRRVIANITATSQLNGTTVTCSAVNQHDVIISKPAYIYVQGQFMLVISKYV